MENTDTTPAAAPEVPSALTESQAAQELLARWQSKAPKPDAKPAPKEPEAAADEVEPEATDEQPEEGDAEAEAEGTAAPVVEDVEFDLEFAGRKHRITPKTLKTDLEKLQAQAKDLEAGSTRKFQQAAEAAKRAEQLGEVVQQHADLYADYRTVDREIQRIGQMDLDALSDSDPVAAQKQLAQLMQLQQAQTRIVGALQEAAQKMTQTRQSLASERAAKGAELLEREIKGWGPTLQSELLAYSKTQGVSDDTLANLYDPAIVKMMYKASRYDALQSAKMKTVAAAKAASPTLKPASAAAKQSQATQKLAKLNDRLSKTGKVEDAANLFLARFQARK